MKTWPQKQGLGPRSGWDADNRQRSREGFSKPLGGSTLLTVSGWGTHSWPAAHVVGTVRGGLHSQPEQLGFNTRNNFLMDSFSALVPVRSCKQAPSGGIGGGGARVGNFQGRGSPLFYSVTQRGIIIKMTVL